MPFLVIAWIGFSVAIALLAKSRGRSSWGFFLLSFFFSPILGLIVVLVAKNLKEEEERLAREKRAHEAHLESIRAITGAKADAAPERVCPFCAETVKAAALKCKHCGAELAPQA